MENDTPPNDAGLEEASQSGNLSIFDLQGIFAHGDEQDTDTQTETEPLEPEEDDDDVEIEATEESDSEEEDNSTESEEEESEEDDEEVDDLSQNDVEYDKVDWSKFDFSKVDWSAINPDSLSTEDAIKINTITGGKASPRIAQLTAEKKQLEAALRDAKQQPENAGSTLAGIDDLNDLASKERDLSANERQINQILHGDEQIDDDGNEFLYEEDGKKYTRKDIKEWLKITQNDLNAIPARRKFLVEKEEADKEAQVIYPELFNPDNPFSGIVEKMKEDPQRSSIFKWPDAYTRIGDMLLGQKTRQQMLNKQSPKAKPKSKPKAPKAPIAPEGQAPPKTTSSTKRKKALESAKESLAESGSVDNLAQYFELKNN